jgi:bacteriocin-like protein
MNEFSLVSADELNQIEGGGNVVGVVRGFFFNPPPPHPGGAPTGGGGDPGFIWGSDDKKLPD